MPKTPLFGINWNLAQWFHVDKIALNSSSWVYFLNSENFTYSLVYQCFASDPSLVYLLWMICA